MVRSLKIVMKGLLEFATQPDIPSSNHNLVVPLWKSIILDYRFFLTLGLWKP